MGTAHLKKVVLESYPDFISVSFFWQIVVLCVYGQTPQNTSSLHWAT